MSGQVVGRQTPLLREAWAGFRLLLATHWRRPRGLLMVLAGFLIGAGTLTVLLAVPAGLERAGAATGSDDVAVVLASAAASEAESNVSPGVADLVASLPQVSRTAQGRPAVVPVLVSGVRVHDPHGRPMTLQVRGVPPDVLTVSGAQSVHLPAGMPPEGRSAVVLGEVSGQRLGFVDGSDDILAMRGIDWKVSGRLEAGGGFWDSEVWMNLSDAQAAFQAPGRISALWVKLDSAESFGEFERELAGDPRLSEVRAVRQSNYYAGQVDFLVRMVRIAGVGIALLLGAGAALAIANALNLAMASRRREVATLRALGFSGAGIVAASVMELLVVAVLAAAIAYGMAWLLLDGRVFMTSTGNQTIYVSLELAAGVGAWALLYNLLLGAVSAIMPIRRLVGRGVAEALRGD